MKLFIIVFFFTLNLFGSSTTEELNSQLHLGQDEGVQNVGLRIKLTGNTDLIYPNLLWHYRMGIRNIQIIDNDVPAEKQEDINSKIQKFYNRVNDICSLGISSKGENGIPTNTQWILEISDRQFLCLYRPLQEILSNHTSASLIFPSCTYQGFDPDAPSHFWPQTDEILTYRTTINDEASVILHNFSSSSSTQKVSKAYIATFSTLDEAVPFTLEMKNDCLPITQVLISSVQHACLRGQDPWGDGQSITPIAITPQEKLLENFVQDFGFNSTTKFGGNYIYVPVPKSGWSTISRALGSYEMERQLERASYKDFNKFPYEIAGRYQQLCDSKSYKITCIREPYRRILSAYLEKIFETEDTYFKEHLGFTATSRISFIDFLKVLKEKEFKKTDRHFQPQWLLTMIPIISYDKVIRLENFNQEFQDVMDVLDSVVTR